MIIDVLLEAVGLLVDLLVLGLPTADPPFTANMSGWASTLNGYLLFFDGLIPLTDLLTLLRWFGVVFLPGWLGFKGIRFVVGHLPFLGGS